jgi:hypothetical protein
VADSGPRTLQAFAVERRCHRRHVIVEAALRQQHRKHQGLADRAPNGSRKQHVEQGARPRGDHHDHEHGRDASEAAVAVGVILAIETALQSPGQEPHQCHRMRHPAEDGRGIPDDGIECQRRQQQDQRIEPRGIRRKERGHGSASIGARVNRVNRGSLQSDLIGSGFRT